MLSASSPDSPIFFSRKGAENMAPSLKARKPFAGMVFFYAFSLLANSDRPLHHRLYQDRVGRHYRKCDKYRTPPVLLVEF